MALIYNCKLKIDVIATRWERHGDHPNVQSVPDNVNINGVTDKSHLGMLTNEQGHGTIFGGPIWIMDVGGRTFPVDDAYFNDFYEILSQKIEEPMNVPT